MVAVPTHDGLTLSVTDEGPADGPVVLAVHGFASSEQANWRAAGWSRALTAAGYRLLTYDQRGHGDSDKPHDAGSYGPGILRSDALTVLDAFEVPAAHWLGYSFGARLGLEVTSHAPERVRSLSLGGLPARDPLSAFDLAAARAHLETGDEVRDAVTAEFVAMATMPGNDPLALLAFVEGLRSIEQDPIDRGQVPTLLVTGEQDTIAVDSAALAERLGAAFVSLPGRTHSNAISARGFKEAVLEFLAGLSRAGAPRG